MKNKCTECYSTDPRVTPLHGAGKCLENHRQYICSQCGRIVCIDSGGERKSRCFFPFSTKEIALLYLKCAEILTNSRCGIYELIYQKGDKRYKIFETKDELNRFLAKNKNVQCDHTTPVYQSKCFTPVLPEQIRYLTKEEVERYLAERKEH